MNPYAPPKSDVRGQREPSQWLGISIASGVAAIGAAYPFYRDVTVFGVPLSSAEVAMPLLFVVCQAWAIGASVYIHQLLTRFRSEHPRISSTAALEAYKHTVRVNMHLALVQIGVLGLGVVCGIAILMQYRALGLAAVVTSYALIGIASKRLHTLEVDTRATPVDSPELSSEFERVSHAWLQRALPNF